MISVKICGITNPLDAEMCVKAGARALGFVFYGLSPRAISPAGAREIASSLPHGIRKVGVFVGAKKEHVLDTAERAGLDMVQLSGDELVVDCQWLTARGARVIKAIRPRTARDVQRLADYRDHVFAFNVDAFKEGQYGGTGQVADWSLARLAKQFERPVILAGGLNGATVVPALRAVDPAALDVCSGVEREPGRKDAKKLKGFFEALWRYDEELRARDAGGTNPGLSGRFDLVSSGRFRAEPSRNPPASGPSTTSGGAPGFASSGPIRVGPPPRVSPPAAPPPSEQRGTVQEAELQDRAYNADGSSAVKRPGESPPPVEPPLVDRANDSGASRQPPAGPRT